VRAAVRIVQVAMIVLVGLVALAGDWLVARVQRTGEPVGPRRLRTMLILCGLALLTVLVRLFTLQVIHHEEYAQFARDNQLERERIQGPRGFLRDRYGQIVDPFGHVWSIATHMRDLTPEEILEAGREAMAKGCAETSA